MTAALEGDTAVVQGLLVRGADLETRVPPKASAHSHQARDNARGWTALTHAVAAGQLDTVKVRPTNIDIFGKASEYRYLWQDQRI